MENKYWNSTAKGQTPFSPQFLAVACFLSMQLIKEFLTHNLELLSGGNVHATPIPSDKASTLCAFSQTWGERDVPPTAPCWGGTCSCLRLLLPLQRMH